MNTDTTDRVYLIENDEFLIAKYFGSATSMNSLFDNTDNTDREHPKQHVVEDFNRRFPPGTFVMLRKDSGRILTRVTREAYLHGNTPVAFFRDVSGCYAIEGRVEAYGNG